MLPTYVYIYIDYCNWTFTYLSLKINDYMLVVTVIFYLYLHLLYCN